MRQITIQFLAFWTFVNPPSNFYTINFIVKVTFSSMQKMWTLTTFNSNITCKIHCMNMFSINVLLLYFFMPQTGLLKISDECDIVLARSGLLVWEMFYSGSVSVHSLNHALSRQMSCPGWLNIFYSTHQMIATGISERLRRKFGILDLW